MHTYKKRTELKAQTGGDGKLYCFSTKLGFLLYRLLKEDGCDVKLSIVDNSVYDGFTYQCFPKKDMKIEIVGKIYLFSICNSNICKHNKSLIQRLDLLLNQKGYEVESKHQNNVFEKLREIEGFGGTAISSYEIVIIDTDVIADPQEIAEINGLQEAIGLAKDPEKDSCWEARDLSYRQIDHNIDYYSENYSFCEDETIKKVYYISQKKPVPKKVPNEAH